MREYPFDIPIFPDNSPKEFKNACEKIERAFPDMEKAPLLVDVDGSTIQVYKQGNEEAVVYDNYDVGAVYVMSDIDIRAALS